MIPAADANAPATTSPREVRRVVVSSLLGTSMEWYEYFVYGLFATLVFNQLFFPKLDPTVGTIAALLTFAGGFVARPLGAVLFGHLGDRLGRRTTLIITIVAIGTATGAIGLLPTYETIGIWAPILLALLRFVQGLSVGGEWGGAILMAVEHAPARTRARYGAMPQLGSPIGTLVSSGALALVTMLPHDQLMSWGWRLPFLIAFPFLGIALYLRIRVDESPLFQQVRRDHREVRIPLLRLLRTSGSRVLIAIAASMFASGAFYLMTTYAVEFGTKTLTFSANTMLLATSIGAVLEGAAVLLSGRFADRRSASRVMLVGAVACVVGALPIALLISTRNPALVVIGVALGIGLLGIPYGPIGTVLAQLFTDETRYSAVAVSFNVAGLVGGFVPSIAVAMTGALHNPAWTIGILLAIICAITTVGTITAGIALRHNDALEPAAPQ